MKTETSSTEVILQGVILLLVAGISDILGKLLQLMEVVVRLFANTQDRRLTELLGQAGGDLLHFISSNFTDLLHLTGG